MVNRDRELEKRTRDSPAKPFSPRRFLRRYYPTLILCSIGSASFIAGLAQQVGRDAFAGELVFLGVGTCVLGAFAPRILKVEVGAGGVKASMQEEEVDESTRFLSGEDPAPEELEDEDQIVAARTALAGEAIAGLLEAKEGPLSFARLRLYLLDESAQLLVPVHVGDEDASPPLEAFPIGAGATGEAYASGQFILVTGDAVSDATYGLTPAQQEHFRSLTAVAAAPIQNAAGETIGVLTATTGEPTGPSHLMSDDAYYDMLSRSMLLARVLVDVLRWFGDGSPPSRYSE